MQKTTKILALSNLIRLGLVNEKSAYSTLRKWLKYQHKLQGILLTQSTNGISIVPNDKVDSVARHCRFFITAHFGMYPLLIKYLCEQSPSQKLIVLIGKQQALHGITQLTDKYGLNVEFVEVGESFLFFRKLLRFSKQKARFLALTDIPIGINNANEVWLPFLNGSIKAKTGLFKIAEKLGLTPELIMSDYNLRHNNVNLSIHPVSDIHETFFHFAEYLQKAPHLWDKVMDVHKFYRCHTPDGLFIPFKMQGDYFIKNVADDRVLRINQSFFHRVQALKKAPINSEIFKEHTDKIHEQTNIRIRQAI